MPSTASPRSGIDARADASPAGGPSSQSSGAGGPLPHALRAHRAASRAAPFHVGFAVLLHRPRHFERVSPRVRRRRAAAAAASDAIRGGVVVQKFWNVGTSREDADGSGGARDVGAGSRRASRKSRLGAMSATRATTTPVRALPPSRYDTDFQEIDRLEAGRLVAADADDQSPRRREYAIKKVRMATKSGGPVSPPPPRACCARWRRSPASSTPPWCDTIRRGSRRRLRRLETRGEPMSSTFDASDGGTSDGRPRGSDGNLRPGRRRGNHGNLWLRGGR